MKKYTKLGYFQLTSNYRKINNILKNNNLPENAGIFPVGCLFGTNIIFMRNDILKELTEDEFGALMLHEMYHLIENSSDEKAADNAAIEEYGITVLNSALTKLLKIISIDEEHYYQLLKANTSGVYKHRREWLGLI